MRKITLAVAVIAALAFAVPAIGAGVYVADPTGQFTQGDDAGYIEVSDHGAQACNENPNTPAGENLTGSAYINSNGEAYEEGGPTYGNANIGAGDYDGEGTDDGNPDNGTEENDCAAPEGTEVAAP